MEVVVGDVGEGCPLIILIRTVSRRNRISGLETVYTIDLSLCTQSADPNLFRAHLLAELS